MRKASILSVVVIGGIGIAWLAEAQIQRRAVKAPVAQAQVLKIERRADVLAKLKQEITIEGFFYDGSIPMIINDMELIRADRLLPEDAYVPVVGALPPGLKWGDTVRMTGKAQKPSRADGASVRRESVVLKVAAPDKAMVVKPTTFAVLDKSRLMLSPKLIGTLVAAMQQEYAVLIAGGGSPANNHVRYWNDLKTMYNILRSAGYPAANITVIYADGVARDASMPVNYSATRANIATTFNRLKTKMTATSTLYIMLNDHGGRDPGDPNGDEVEDDRDENLSLWYDKISDDQFTTEVAKVTNYRKMIIQMKQCYSGGFVGDLTQAKRIVMSSCSPSQLSWAHSSLQFGEFTYWYFAALTGNKPDGSGSVNADANGDGKVSILEAYNFARANDSASEAPCYEDNGARPCQSDVPVPAGGDGALGAATYL